MMSCQRQNSASVSGDGVVVREMRPYTYSTKLKRIGRMVFFVFDIFTIMCTVCQHVALVIIQDNVQCLL